MAAKCAETAHDYFKFDDATIVCHKCGDQRVVDVQALIARLPQPIYLPCPLPHYPNYPQWPRPYWQPWTVIGSGTSDPLPPDTTITYNHVTVS